MRNECKNDEIVQKKRRNKVIFASVEKKKEMLQEWIESVSIVKLVGWRESIETSRV